jgi:cobalt-zinc-cadmium efflux system membrane fusion protein
MSRRVAVTAAVGGMVLVALALLLGPRAATARVDAGPVGELIVARGAVVPSAGVLHVYAPTDGRVVRILGHEGDSVEAGQALAEIDVSGRREQLTSPARAVILERHVEWGDYALAAEHGATEPLFALADPTRTELKIEVEEPDAAKLAPNLPVSITAVGSELPKVQGRVERVAARLEQRSIGADDARVRAAGMVRVCAVAWNGPPPAWPIGMRADAIIEVRRRNAAVRVPRAALSVRDGRSVVARRIAFWTREIPVEVVSVDAAYAEVRGVAVGTEVVIPTRATRDN